LRSLLFMGRLIILSGPSCVGKGPLHTAFKTFYPELAATLRKLVLFNCRSSRPGEIDGRDYHFRSRDEVEGLREKEGFIVLNVRGDLQAVDLDDAERKLDAGDLFFEGNPFVGRKLLEVFATKVTVLSIFLSPLSQEEILFLQAQKHRLSLADFLTDLMRRKLLRRTRRQKNNLSLKDLENIERRAASAYSELQEAWNFEYVIPNHDGEDSENWDAFYYPIGDARKAMLAFVGLVGGKVSPLVEKWEEGLLS
jgi:guanylate kinase